MIGVIMFIRRGRRLEILSKEQIYRIHLASMKILENIGVKVNHEEALKMLDNLGVYVDYRSKKVKISESLVKEVIKKTPSEFTYYGRKTKLDVRDDYVYYLSGGSPLKVMDLDGNIRNATLKDLSELVRLYDALNYVDLIAGTLTPTDIPNELRHLYSFLVKLENTVKPITVGSLLNDDVCMDVINLASIAAGGIEELCRKPIIMAWENPLSPLSHIKSQVAQILIFAKYHLPILIASAPQSGSTSPITLAGTLAQQNAEILSGFVIAYAASEDRGMPPLIYGTAPAVLDLRYGTMVYGCPESILINIASVQMARYYGIPCRCTAGSTESKSIDIQAGYETAMTLISVALAGGNLIMNATGGAMGPGVDIMSFEKAVIDNEIAGYIDRFLKGIDVDDETLALDVIEEVGSEGHYMTRKHTLKHYKEHYIPVLSDRKPTERWLLDRDDIRRKAREMALKILKEHKPEELDKDVKMEIEKYINEVKSKRLK